MCIRDRLNDVGPIITAISLQRIGQYVGRAPRFADFAAAEAYIRAVSYTHLRAHETVLDLVCRLLLEKKTNNISLTQMTVHTIEL